MYLKRSVFIFLTTMLFSGSSLQADEGMWLPLLMNETHYEAMRARGFRLNPEDLYNINNTSLKDAIVLFGRGCTAGLVSAEGLLFTNHHCGYSRIQSHSSVTTDYLTHGFWASDRSEELPNEGLTVSRLVRMEDVTAQVKKSLNSTMSEKEREDVIRRVSAAIVAEVTSGTHYNAEVKPFYYGNQFILMVIEVFRDVRIVGAPPSAIGKFGGDTDNWMWPRHTGDFSIFRIYAGKDNKPAAYSKENQPYKPLRFLEISTKGVTENDFTLVYGFPAQTEKYVPSHAIEMYLKHKYPAIVKVRDHELAVINRTMATSDSLRIMYAGRQASVANGWKKFMGVIPGLQQYKVTEMKQAAETGMADRLENDPLKQAQYLEILQGYSDAYKELTPLDNWNTFFTECFWKQPFFRFVFRAYWLPDINSGNQEDTERINKTITEINQALPGFYSSVNIQTEKEIMSEMIKIFFEGVPESQIPSGFLKAYKKSKGGYDLMVETLFKGSLFRSEALASEFFQNWNDKKSVRKLKNDPLFNMMKEMVDMYRQSYHNQILSINQTIDSLHRLNMAILLEMPEGKNLYPDANSTLRISFGQVMGSYPRDGVKYLYQTTLDGIFLKESAGFEDYAVPGRLRDIANPEFYPPYGVNGTMPVAFIANNHTTGGNSGSPVLNAYGQLIGLNFDRAWEGTMSDLNFEPEICRNISLDVRYLLFIVERYAGATNLINEMVIVR